MSAVSASREFALEVAERIDGVGPITVTRFFSGAGLVADGAQFAFVIDGSMYLRVDDETRAAFVALGARPFIYRTKTKSITSVNYYQIPEDLLFDREELRGWVVKAHRVAVAVQRAKVQRAKKPAKKRAVAKKKAPRKKSPARKK